MRHRRVRCQPPRARPPIVVRTTRTPAVRVQHGSDTSCDEVLCHTNEHVQSHACVACPAGSTNDAGDGAASGDTVCDHTICGANTHVLNHVCTACPPGHDHPSGDDATGADTSCSAIMCGANQRVQNHVCTACPAGTTNAAAATRSAIQPFVVQTRTFRIISVRRARRAPSTMPVTTLRLRTLFVTSCSAALTSTCKVINALRVLPVRRTIRATTRLALTRSAIQSSARRTCACKITRVWRA